MPAKNLILLDVIGGVTVQNCIECGEMKPLTNEFFAIRSASSTGFNSRCKVCVNVNQRALRTDNPEYETYKANQREANKTKYAENPEYYQEKSRLWRLANPEKALEAQRRFESTRVRSFERYGITEAQYDAMLHAQGGVCAIKGCNRTNKNKRMDIDHDHACCPGDRSCGKCVRGLVCGPCNKAMGLLRDDPSLASALSDYLIVGGFQYE